MSQGSKENWERMNKQKQAKPPKCEHKNQKHLRDDWDHDVAIYVCLDCDVWLRGFIPD